MTVIASTLTSATEKGHSLMASMMFAPAGPLAARGGVIAGLELTKTTGMGWQLGTGRGGVQWTSVADGGLVPFAVTAAETGLFSNGDATKDRIDKVIAKISAGTVQVAIVEGALPVAGSPVTPATPADAVALFSVLIPALTSAGTGGWSTANITDLRAWAGIGNDVGDLKFSGRATAPVGWLVAMGQTVSRTLYAELFAAIGTAFGAGDGSTTFGLPDLRGRMPVGYSAGDANFGILAAQQGAKTHGHSLSNSAWAKIEYGTTAPFLAGSVVTVSPWTSNRQIVGAGGSSGGVATVSNGIGLGGGTDTGSSLQPSLTLTPLIKA